VLNPQRTLEPGGHETVRQVHGNGLSDVGDHVQRMDDPTHQVMG
jgi:hypothetical protein